MEKKVICLAQWKRGQFAMLRLTEEYANNDFAAMAFCCRELKRTSLIIAGLGHAEWLWHHRERSGQAGQGLLAPDLWYHPVASQQQGGKGPTAGGRSHLPNRHRHENVSRGEILLLKHLLFI